MLRVAEHVALTDTGHQRATNEDSHLERAPLFVIADGMGGARAGEVASQLAIAHFADGLPGSESDDAGPRLERAVREANAEIHELSEADERRAGMGTTVTAAYVGAGGVTIAHVGDSRAYRLHAGELERITEDHSLVEELVRQGRLTEEEAEEHPQRSIITRALGPEADVEVDLFDVAATDGDVFLICSDGLTSMVAESAVAEILRGAPDLRASAARLVDAALQAGGRDNVTVVLFRVEEVGRLAERPTEALAPAAADAVADDDQGDREPVPAAVARPAERPLRRRSPRGARRGGRRAPRMPRAGARPRARRRRRRIALVGALVGAIGVIAIALLLAAQAVYFVGTDSYGQVTVYNGFPYTLPGGIRLYTKYFVSGITAAELSPLERGRLFNDQLRSQRSATQLVSKLELDQIAGQ